MTASLADLESQRDALLRRLLLLGDFRPGSISATSGRCGKPSCHCHQPGQPGHGPHWRLTYKRQGKTVSESLPDEPTRRKAEREIAAYREFQQLSRQLLDVNLAICRLRPPAMAEGAGPVLNPTLIRGIVASRPGLCRYGLGGKAVESGMRGGSVECWS